jgi:hypothetical protein
VLDGVVYGALVGLGFQVVENVVYAVNAVALRGNGDQMAPVVSTFFLRGFLAGLWSHTLFSALAGAGVAYVVVRTDRPLSVRLVVAGGALGGAWLCHFGWNTPLFADGLSGDGFGLLAALLVKGIPPLAMILVMVRSARHREANYYVAQLVALGDPRVATEGELRALSTGHMRAAARRYAHGRAGIRGRTAVRRLQRAQARLAVELSRLGEREERAERAPQSRANGGPGEREERAERAPQSHLSVPPLVRWYREALVQRYRLEALGHAEAVAPAWRRGDVRLWVLGTIGLVVFVASIWVGIRALGGG